MRIGEIGLCAIGLPLVWKAKATELMLDGMTREIDIPDSSKYPQWKLGRDILDPYFENEETGERLDFRPHMTRERLPI